MIRGTGTLPTDMIQSMFFALDPLMSVRKFLGFSRMDMKSRKAEAFVALEDWINDGVPLAGPVARETLFGWYGENTPARGEWRISGQPVDPARIHLPSLVLVPAQDRIVSPGAATALGQAIPAATIRTVPLGHIGMVVSRRARKQSWTIVVDWLNRSPA